MKSTDVVVVMGSESDLPVMSGAIKVLKKFNIRYSVEVVSAHRTPKLLEKSVGVWESKGVRVIIAGAGGAAHLPGMLASFSILPVIGVPVKSKSLDGLDSLLSIVQMPMGVPVATVGINNAGNAALLAAKILQTASSGNIQKKMEIKLRNYKKQLLKDVSGMRKRVSRKGQV